ncbi:MAG: hypothetical protein Q7S14_00950, partial [bacterium]|nr:hypothetical protein [bacterium]
AISPWSLQMSRGAFEGNLATLFSGLGILLFIKAINNKKLVLFIFSSLFLILSIYTFNSHRVFVPLITGALCLTYFKEIFSQKRNFLLFLVSCFLFLLPLVPYFMTSESRLRFQEVSWTNDLAPIELSNSRINTDNNSVFAKIIHNRRVIWAGEFLKHYTDHFKPDFLFFTGDINERLSTRKIGEMYLIELPFFLAGLYFLVRHRTKASAVIFAWLLLAPIPAALARETPHALRALNILPIPQIITAIGISQIKNKKFLYLIFAIFFVSCFLYLGDYYTKYSERSKNSWQYGYKQIVEEVKKVENQYPCVSITEDAGRPYIYFLLYNKYPPQKYWSNRVAERDWFGFWTVHSFDKYYFGTNPGNCLRVDYVNNEFVISGI